MFKVLQHLTILILLLVGLAYPIIWVPVLIWAILMANLPTQHKPSTPRSSSTPVEPAPKESTSTTPYTPKYSSKQDYLQSSAWQSRRKAVLKRDSYTCQKCGIIDVPLEVHHLHYANFTEEPLEDLVSLCRTCHQSIHDKHGYDFYGQFPIN